MTNVRDLIAAQCDAVKNLLLAKNAEYGNSALAPIGVFADPDPEALIRTRIDDKLKRIQTTRGTDPTIVEDTELDLIGYLILLRVGRDYAQHLTDKESVGQ